ncbi:hypothetical protein HNR06_003020 [Nocardiopsis arvandica]|uniref:DUF4352 domain-containing protein n=1 Tax=Nocardiopsis sinuspersici TaxID=501010 RepID=A0A7Z0BJS6_9ACTN|nr:DUF4352 domain-containing protein [Nocardiopsis sinuspersici]NYH53431.1 hypothetical protein [Nocardiopsis sinuspersici]
MGPPPPGFGPPGPGGPAGPPGLPSPQDPRGPERTSPWLFVGLGCGGLFVVGVVLALLTVFVLDDRGEDGGDGSTGSGGTRAPTATDTPGTNETVEHDGMLFTVTGTEVTAEIDGHHPRGEYLIVHVDVADAGAGEFWRDEQHVYTSSGERIGEDYNATLELQSPIWQDLPDDGSPVGVSIAFDVESAADVSHIGLSARFRGGNEVEVDLGD